MYVFSCLFYLVHHVCWRSMLGFGLTWSCFIIRLRVSFPTRFAWNRTCPVSTTNMVVFYMVLGLNSLRAVPTGFLGYFYYPPWVARIMMTLSFSCRMWLLHWVLWMTSLLTAMAIPCVDANDRLCNIFWMLAPISQLRGSSLTMMFNTGKFIFDSLKYTLVLCWLSNPMYQIAFGVISQYGMRGRINEKRACHSTELTRLFVLTQDKLVNKKL